MKTLIVVERLSDWPVEIPDVEVIDAWSYLTKPELSGRKNTKLFNLCRSFKYQSTGFYVSLLAEARGHKPLPSVLTLQDLRTPAIVRYVSDELDDMLQKALHPLVGEKFTLSVYFGRNVAKRYDRLSRQLFDLFQAPLLRFRFARTDGAWQIRSVKAIAGSDVPSAHWPFVMDAASRHLARGSGRRKQRATARFDLAILHDPSEGENSPSNEAALNKFVKAGEAAGLAVELIKREDLGQLLEYDALFIRATTFVNHYTYRTARRAASEGMVVIDDPVSIARCTNKVYLAELLGRHKVPQPKTIVVHRENVEAIASELGFPCVLKKPDGSFSRGVVKITSDEELQDRIGEFFAESELIVAQEFLPTTFDWRIGILNRRPVFACKYYMAPGHWQIIQQKTHGPGRYGKAETMPVEVAPRKAVQLAQKAADLIGDGLYGVDVKENDGRFTIIEVNDNPNIDSGCEDLILRDDLYRRIMEEFVRRIEAKKAGNM
jgi:glutathione synthase/RimK-type ligase-like ATP-grasp enzyme